jgi:hypothetical protein
MSTPSHTEATVETKELEAGRGLDAEVAEKIFGWQWATLNPAIYTVLTGNRFLRPPGNLGVAFVPCGESLPLDERYFDAVPSYSTDIKTAWEVVEKMLSQGWHFNLECEPESGESPCAMFYRGRDSYGERDAHSMSATTAPLAICLAALKATTDAKE